MNLRRSRDDKVIGGVCGGIANALNVSSSTVRLICALAVILGGLSVWLYIIAWIFMPSD
ncbi:MAG: PspC domain-containing protein [Spirochaetes bacterium]|nr:PspC domain-containing protein [Spirochaetota bacterium]MBU0955692.1 PspC domain-containing protein [Spirochaetota bacterium]